MKSAVAAKRGISALISDYKVAMRCMGLPVSIITCSHDGLEAGMTISSLSSVSVNPHPMISFNIQKPSRTSRFLDANDGRFAVNILFPSPETAKMARLFAGQRGHEVNPFKEMSESFSSFKSIPVVTNSSHILACRIHTVVPVQDHEIVVAEVEDVKKGSGQCMVYCNERFHKLGDEVVPEILFL